MDGLRGGVIDQGAVRIGTGRIGTDSERRLDRGGDSDERAKWIEGTERDSHNPSLLHRGRWRLADPPSHSFRMTDEDRMHAEGATRDLARIFGDVLDRFRCAPDIPRSPPEIGEADTRALVPGRRLRESEERSVGEIGRDQGFPQASPQSVADCRGKTSGQIRSAGPLEAPLMRFYKT